MCKQISLMNVSLVVIAVGMHWFITNLLLWKFKLLPCILMRAKEECACYPVGLGSWRDKTLAFLTLILSVGVPYIDIDIVFILLKWEIISWERIIMGSVVAFVFGFC